MNLFSVLETLVKHTETKINEHITLNPDQIKNQEYLLPKV